MGNPASPGHRSCQKRVAGAEDSKAGLARVWFDRAAVCFPSLFNITKEGSVLKPGVLNTGRAKRHPRPVRR